MDFIEGERFYKQNGPDEAKLALRAANLLAKTKHEIFDERVTRTIEAYETAGGVLSEYEKEATLPYARSAVASELLGSIYDEGATEDEALY